MSTLGRFTNSLLSAVNENVMTLANVNFDLSLVKFDAPKEFLEVGSHLSTQRQDNAEDGPFHKTLRKLGELSSSLFPLCHS